MYSTRVSRRIRATPAEVYRALIDADSVASWRVPEGMTSEVHEWHAETGGRFRVTLTYNDRRAGKSGTRTDTYHGCFEALIPNEQVVEQLEFETSEPGLTGVMTMTTTLARADGGTEVLIVHDGIPDAVPPEANETGTRMALDKLAALVESAARR